MMRLPSAVGERQALRPEAVPHCGPSLATADRGNATADRGNAAVPRTARMRPASWAACLTLIAGTAALWAAPSGAQAPTSVEGARSEAQTVELYLSENAMQLMYARDTDVGELGRNPARAGFFINENRDLIGIADMLVDVGETRRRPYWDLDVGPRAYGALMAVEDQDVFSIAFGGRLSYFLGPRRGTSISLTAFYAPDISTFGNADNVKDVSFRIETPLTPNSNLFFGYRIFEFDLTVDREVDDNTHVGIRYRF